jgi:hypothetical protein
VSAARDSAGGKDERETNAWPWPDSLDAVVAAPKHHQLVLENDRVRVLDTRIHHLIRVELRAR